LEAIAKVFFYEEAVEVEGHDSHVDPAERNAPRDQVAAGFLRFAHQPRATPALDLHHLQLALLSLSSLLLQAGMCRDSINI
jgi:hypothetical protein